MLVPAAHVRLALPHPGLGEYIKAYIGVDQHVTETAHVGALPSPVLMVSWGGRVELLAAAGTRHAGEPLPLVAVCGPFTADHRVEIEAGCCVFHVRFSPTGMLALLAERPAANEWDDGLHTAVLCWARSIADAPSFAARVALADAFWRSRLPAVDVWSTTAVGLVTKSGGALPVASLAHALGVSARTLRRRFTDDVGLNTKTFAQIERYRQAHGYLLRTPGATWRDVCARFGYADQAHFVRAFRRYTGVAPTQWQSEGHGFDVGMGLREEGAYANGTRL